MTSTKFEITSIEIRDRSTGAGKIWLQVTGMDRESSDRHIKDQLTRYHHFWADDAFVEPASPLPGATVYVIETADVLESLRIFKITGWVYHRKFSYSLFSPVADQTISDQRAAEIVALKRRISKLTRHFERSQRLIDSAFGTMRAAEKHLQECREMFSDDVSGDEDEEV